MQLPHRDAVDPTEVEKLVCRALHVQPRGSDELTVPEIADAIDEDLDFPDFVSYSEITNALRHLRKDGLIDRRRLREPGDPYARVYWLTARGRAATEAIQ